MNRGLSDPARAAARDLARTARDFWLRGWMLGTSGNLSARIDLETGGREVVITASGKPKGRLGPKDFLRLGEDGGVLEARGGRPSAETAIHLAVYARLPGVRSVLHVHSPYATVLSDTDAEGIELRDFEMMKGLGHAGPFGTLLVPVLPNAPDARDIAVGLEKLDLERCPGALIRNHGVYAWGPSIAQAEAHVEIFEFLFHQVWLRRGTGAR